jgi:hypothetical protein
LGATLHDLPPRKENSVHRHFRVAQHLEYCSTPFRIIGSITSRAPSNDRCSLRLFREFASLSDDSRPDFLYSPSDREFSDRTPACWYGGFAFALLMHLEKEMHHKPVSCSLRVACALRVHKFGPEYSAPTQEKAAEIDEVTNQAFGSLPRHQSAGRGSEEAANAGGTTPQSKRHWKESTFRPSLARCGQRCRRR